MNLRQNLCLASLLLVATSAFAVNIPSFESAKPNEHCRKEWTKRGQLDTGMYEYCMKNEREGYAELKSLASKYRSQPWIQSAVDFSKNKWTERGVTTFTMANHTLKQITEGYEDIEYEKKQSGFNRSKLFGCLNKWDIQFDMVVYCYKN